MSASPKLETLLYITNTNAHETNQQKLTSTVKMC